MTDKGPKHRDRPGVDRYGRTDLHIAARDGDVARLKALLAAGADPRAADNEGWTPLHVAAHSYGPSACEALLAAGAQVDAVDAYGNTPLWRATFESCGRGEIIHILRRSGADPRLRNSRGVSPVALARTIANYDVAQYFNDIDP